MNHFIHVLSSFVKMTSRAILIAVFLLVNTFFIRAHEPSLRVYYKFDSSAVDAAYLSNSQVITRFDASFRSGNLSGFEIVSFSSPEGNLGYNESLAARRANALRSYLKSRYPQLDGKITVRPCGESWDELGAFVKGDSRLSDSAKSRVLGIIYSDDAADVKERSLKALPEYRGIYASYFRQLRFAEIRITDSSNTDSTISSTGVDSVSVSGAVSAAGSAAASAFGTGAAANAVHFPLRGTDLDAGFNGNASALEAIGQLLGGRDPKEVTHITISSYTSPEGPVAINDRYAVGRGKALRDYIISTYPALAGKVSVHSAGEAWEDLRLAVESDATISDASRSNILSIIVSNSAADAKEAKLRSLPEWNHLFEDVFPGLRCARLDVEFGEAPSEPVMPVTEPAEITEPKTTVEPEIPAIADQPAPEVEDEPLAVNDSTLVLKDTTLAIPSVAPAVAPATVAAIEYVPALAVSTNLLLDAATAVNVSVAVPVGNNWSIRAEYTNPWWIFDNNRRALQIQHLSFGARYYPSGSILGLNFGSRSNKRVLTGWYLEGMFGTGKYDIEPYRKGWQGEEWLLQLGGGYSFQLGKHWSLDLGVDFGSMQTGYRYYESNKNDTKLIYKYSGLYSWMGPTNVRASLTYLFYCKSRKGNAKKEVGDE